MLDEFDLTGVWNKRDDRYSDLRTEITAFRIDDEWDESEAQAAQFDELGTTFPQPHQGKEHGEAHRG